MRYITTSLGFIKSSSPDQNGRHYPTFQNAFCEWKVLYFNSNFTVRFVPKCPIDNKSMLIQVACSAPSHYLNQCWPSSLTQTYGPREKWVNEVVLHTISLEFSKLCEQMLTCSYRCEIWQASVKLQMNPTTWHRYFVTYRFRSDLVVRQLFQNPEIHGLLSICA